MARRFTLALLSDLHYAGPAERSRGDNYEYAPVKNPALRFALQSYRHFIWMRHPTRLNHLLDRALAQIGEVDIAVVNGDYALDCEWFGMSDLSAFESATECLAKLRARFGDKLLLNIGDHELGKSSLLGDRGELRLASWQRATGELGLKPLWRVELGNYVLLNCVSTLVALPVFERDLRRAERDAWYQLREQHLAELRAAFASLQPHQRVIFFCHDPTALPFLCREPAIRERLRQIERTVIGHLHSKLFIWKSRVLSGMPVIRFLGRSVQRLSSALNEARHWKAFRPLLCPALAGCELLKDGGWFSVALDGDAREPAKFEFHPLGR